MGLVDISSWFTGPAKVCNYFGDPAVKTISRKTNNNLHSKNDKIQVTYSVKPSKNTISTTNLRVPPQTSLFDIMKIAQEEDYDAFKFNYTMYSFGAKDGATDGAYINSIGGVAEEISNGSGWVWMFYNCNHYLGAAQYDDDLNGCTLSKNGVSITYPKDGDIWLFHYEHRNWNDTHH
ncbi:unnamed protein product [Meganyctiphanes norvegica]|uniref:DUF4430 domain-containing protein n=1 Tax=Meganyctiphanes norvegica TaxID=48144 RepID=A0AAV2PP77_MEGNR